MIQNAYIKTNLPELSSVRPLWGRLPNPTSTFFAPTFLSSAFCWLPQKNQPRHIRAKRSSECMMFFLLRTKNGCRKSHQTGSQPSWRTLNQHNGPSRTPRSNPNPHRNKDLKFRPFCQVNQWGFHKPWNIRSFSTILRGYRFKKKIDSWLLSEAGWEWLDPDWVDLYFLLV